MANEPINGNIEHAKRNVHISTLFLGAAIVVLMGLILIGQIQQNTRLNQATKDIEAKQNCIAIFFLQHGSTEANAQNLDSCNSVGK